MNDKTVNILIEFIKKRLLTRNMLLDSNKFKYDCKWLKKNYYIEYKQIFDTTKFLDTLNPPYSQRIWHIWNNKLCILMCGNCKKVPLKYMSFKEGYNKYCSRKCSALNINTQKTRSKTCIEKYGEGNQTNNKKRKQTWITKYGIDHPSKTKKQKEKIKRSHMTRTKEQKNKSNLKLRQTCLDRYGDENFNNREKAIETCLDIYGTKTPAENEKILAKIKKTKNNRSEDEVSIWKEKYINTSLNRYDTKHPMQNPIIAEKITGYNWYDYILPSGKQINIQGYEPIALDMLLKEYDEEDILYKKSDMPEIWYQWEDKTRHRYYPDFYIPKNNLVIEIKSDYTYKANIEINLLKEEAAVNNGYDYKFIIFNKKGEQLQINEDGER